MNKQAAALFAAIVAVGLGPAVWLGGTLLRGDPVPAAPPAPIATTAITESPSPSPTEPEPPSPEPTTPTPTPTEEIDPDGVWIPPGSTEPRVPSGPEHVTDPTVPTASPDTGPPAVG